MKKKLHPDITNLQIYMGQQNGISNDVAMLLTWFYKSWFLQPLQMPPLKIGAHNLFQCQSTDCCCQCCTMPVAPFRTFSTRHVIKMYLKHNLIGLVMLNQKEYSYCSNHYSTLCIKCFVFSSCLFKVPL